MIAATARATAPILFSILSETRKISPADIHSVSITKRPRPSPKMWLVIPLQSTQNNSLSPYLLSIKCTLESLITVKHAHAHVYVSLTQGESSVYTVCASISHTLAFDQYSLEPIPKIALGYIINACARTLTFSVCRGDGENEQNKMQMRVCTAGRLNLGGSSCYNNNVTMLTKWRRRCR